jgi:hypothetical protein
VGTLILTHSPDKLLDLLLESMKNGNVQSKQQTAVAITALLRQFEADTPQTPNVIKKLLEFAIPLAKDFSNGEV